MEPRRYPHFDRYTATGPFVLDRPYPRPVRRPAHTVIIHRGTRKMELYAPAGYLMCYGTFESMSELADNVLHFLNKYPTTTVLHSPRKDRA